MLLFVRFECKRSCGQVYDSLVQSIFTHYVTLLLPFRLNVLSLFLSFSSSFCQWSVTIGHVWFPTGLEKHLGRRLLEQTLCRGHMPTLNQPCQSTFWSWYVDKQCSVVTDMQTRKIMTCEAWNPATASNWRKMPSGGYQCHWHFSAFEIQTASLEIWVIFDMFDLCIHYF